MIRKFVRPLVRCVRAVEKAPAINVTDQLNESSAQITDNALISKYAEDPHFPFLVSFPRTGSHWLRMLMELYFEQPSLVRAFYYKKAKSYLCFHTHDMDLDVSRKNVIYLYRNPVATIYSQMCYAKEDLDSIQNIEKWSELYGKHLCKWLLLESDSKTKTIIRYENLQTDLVSEFQKITSHFFQKLDKDRLKEIARKVTKDSVRKRTSHDKQVINISSDYEERREIFKELYAKKIHQIIVNQDKRLSDFFAK